MKILFLSVMLFLSTLPCRAQQVSINLGAWDFLIGDWIGDSTAGVPGQGAGWFTFHPDVQNNILIRRNHAEYAAQKGNDTLTHDDFMVVYHEGDTPLKALYLDNEGHVIHYTVSFTPDSEGITFLSDTIAGQPRYRLTYIETGENTIKIYFAVAPPGTPSTFKDYIVATARRKLNH